MLLTAPQRHQAHGDALWRRLLVNMFFIHATGISKITRLSLPAGAGSGQAKLLYAMLCGELEVGREFSGTVSGYAWDRCFAIGYDGPLLPTESRPPRDRARHDSERTDGAARPVPAVQR